MFAALFVAAAGLTACAAQLSAQDVTNGELHVFLECSGGRFSGGCDQREFRTQIDWVNWVRDRADAEVHVIITSQGTGSGGQEYRLDFIGLDELEGEDDQLIYVSLGTDVRDETVRGMTRVLAVGLARYALLAGASTPFEVQGAGPDAPTDRIVSGDEVDDPWNFWVFQTGLDVNMSGESSRRTRRWGGDFEASRVTETWKFDFELGGNWRRTEIDLDSVTTIVDERRNWDTEADLIYALADHWSVGIQTSASSSSSRNQDWTVSALPALEYSFWDYVEAPRRSLRLRYTIGMRHFNYEEETTLGYLEETRSQQELELSISQRQPWGSVFANAEASHYLHDIDLYRISAGGFLSFRIVRGLNLRVDGRASWIADQIFLAAEDISDEEKLLGSRRLPSDFDWRFGVGFSFQFGSIFNNVVNNRF